MGINMQIKTLYVKNYGPFDEFRIELVPERLNIIIGYNGTGKTQLFGAFLFLLFGKKVIRINNKGENNSSTVQVELIHEDTTQILEYSFKNNKFKMYFQNIIEYSKEIIKVDTTYVSHYHEKRPIFMNSENISSNFSLDKTDIDLISNLLLNDPECLIIWKKIVNDNLSPILLGQSKKIFVASLGVERLLRIISVISMHSKLIYKTPLILDEIFFVFDDKHRKFIATLLSRYAEGNQIILFSSENSTEYFKEATAFFTLPLPKAQIVSTISYDSYHINQDSYLIPGNDIIDNNEAKKTDIIRYIKDSILHEEEHRFIEFKEVKGQNPISSILDLVDQYVVAYLNENSNQSGRIIWGVTDEERKVVGVTLNHKQRDELRKHITDKLGQIKPQLTPSLYKVNILQVHDLHLKEITNLYVVEVIVEQHTNDLLYATSKNEIFIKTDGGKRKLNPLEIQQEILHRSKFIK
jgi:AAA15 family ATPase/GTPase